MKQVMTAQMKAAWAACEYQSDDRLDPRVNPLFKEGFTACHDLLMPLLIEAIPHVVGNQHWPDGETAALVKRIEEVIGQ